MQCLYALESELEAQDAAEASLQKVTDQGIRMLRSRFENSGDLFSVLLQYMVHIARYAEIDAHLRASKYLPSDEDRNVNVKIAGNTFLWQLVENDSFKVQTETVRLTRQIDESRVKKLYQKLSRSAPYLEYIRTESREPKSEKDIMWYIWQTVMMEDEDFQSYLNDEWVNWEDDKEMMSMLAENVFKLPARINLSHFISDEKAEFARALLKAVLEKSPFAMEYIQPRLNNWDVERIALIDLVVLKMGFCEFIYFPTIPTRVTLNEYIEIAKDYSTSQSGQFVNGVLDSILKRLTEENKIRKVERSK